MNVIYFIFKNYSKNILTGQIIFRMCQTMSHSENKIKCKEGKIPCPIAELNLKATLMGGQSFRWTERNDTYIGVFAGYVWKLNQTETHLCYTITGSLNDKKDYAKLLYDYFQLDISVVKYKNIWSSIDPYFKKCYDQVGPVRILEQDVVENLISFICSSNNNITRISSMVEKLCVMFGNEICIIDDHKYYAFPTINQLIEKNIEPALRNAGFGYRAKYIANTIKKLENLGGRNWLLHLHKRNNSTYDETRQQLMTLPGIGPKVADCICLMSLGHLEAIPVDTHIFQVAQANYLPDLIKQKTVTPKIHSEVSEHLRKLWGSLAGWAQTIVFCAKIDVDLPQGGKRKRKLECK